MAVAKVTLITIQLYRQVSIVCIAFLRSAQAVTHTFIYNECDYISSSVFVTTLHDSISPVQA